MIISHKYRYIFIRIPKTASTSIEIELSKLCGPEDIITPITFNNDPENRVEDYRGPQNNTRDLRSFGLGDWYRMITRRKPLDLRHAHAAQARKLVGREIWDQYFKFCMVRNPFDRAVSFYFWRMKNWQKKHEQSPPEINDFILSLPESRLSTWARYTIDNRIAVDFIGRFENLDADLAIVEDKIGLPALVLPHAKSSTRKDRRHYSELLNPAARRHIEKACALEISAFDYAWGTGSEAVDTKGGKHDNKS
jgi:hypothetical protein